MTFSGVFHYSFIAYIRKKYISLTLYELKNIIFFFTFSDAEELSSRLMHTIIDIRNDENGRVILEEARKDKIVNPLDLRCIYLEEILGMFR